jgi:hypothetical protein
VKKQSDDLLDDFVFAVVEDHRRPDVVLAIYDQPGPAFRHANENPAYIVRCWPLKSEYP